MLVKFIDTNNIEIQNKETILYRDNIQIINPKDEDFILDGYKQLIVDEIPEYDMTKEYIESFYEENDNNVIQKWEIKELELEEYHD